MTADRQDVRQQTVYYRLKVCLNFLQTVLNLMEQQMVCYCRLKALQLLKDLTVLKPTTLMSVPKVLLSALKQKKLRLKRQETYG